MIEKDCLSENAKTLDEFIFEYFNNARPDDVAELIEEWKKRLESYGHSGGDE